MAPIERKPLPPPNSSATTITEADRAEMMAHANAVIDYYLNGPGSYWDSGTRKPLISDDEFRKADTTVNDLKKFKDRVIAAKQFSDDPGSVMDSIIALIDQATRQIEDAARYSEGRNTIEHLPPDTIDPIDDPRVISPRALNNAVMPIVFEEGQRAAPLLRNNVTDWPAALVGASRARGKLRISVFEVGAPAAPSVSSTGLRSPDRRGALGGGSNGSFVDLPGGLAGRIDAIAGTRPADVDPRTLLEWTL